MLTQSKLTQKSARILENRAESLLLKPEAYFCQPSLSQDSKFLIHSVAERCDMVLPHAFRARHLRNTGFGSEVRHGVTSSVSRETSSTQAFARSLVNACEYHAYLAIYLPIYLSLSLSIYIYIYISVFLCLYILSLSLYIHIYIYTHIHVYIYIYIHIYIYIYIYIYIHINNYVYINTLPSPPPSPPPALPHQLCIS